MIFNSFAPNANLFKYKLSNKAKGSSKAVKRFFILFFV